jgi:hypothetical protein
MMMVVGTMFVIRDSRVTNDGFHPKPFEPNGNCWGTRSPQSGNGPFCPRLRFRFDNLASLWNFIIIVIDKLLEGTQHGRLPFSNRLAQSRL